MEFDGSIERNEIPEIPMQAVREALVNSFCHRDYRMSQNNEGCIYKNRIEIYNPGSFPKGLTPQDFIEGLERSNDIETFSRLRWIANARKAPGVKVDFQILKTGFIVVFCRNEIGEVT